MDARGPAPPATPRRAERLVSPSRANGARCGSSSPGPRLHRRDDAADDWPAAAVLTNSGRLLSSNALFDRLTSLFLPGAFGSVVIADSRAHRLLQEALDPNSGTIRSIPIAEAEGRRPCVLHVLPLRRNAHDIFSGGDMLIALTTLSASSASPSAAVLESLFDLTQSEVSFTTALMQGLTVQEAARTCGLTESSGRTYLARIFAKTGTHRQSELITLLSSTHPLSSGNDTLAIDGFRRPAGPARREGPYAEIARTADFRRSAV
jgi:DNA-binding CsgD family transcriptional regulator